MSFLKEIRDLFRAILKEIRDSFHAIQVFWRIECSSLMCVRVFNKKHKKISDVFERKNIMIFRNIPGLEVLLIHFPFSSMISNPEKNGPVYNFITRLCKKREMRYGFIHIKNLNDNVPKCIRDHLVNRVSLDAFRINDPGPEIIAEKAGFYFYTFVA